MVTRLSEGNRDEQTAVSLQHASQLAERCEASSAVALHHEPVPGVVRADVLECGHEQDLVERVIGEREPANVGLDGLHAVDVPRSEIGADELHACTEQPGDVRRLRKRVPDLEHTPSGAQPREHPGNLDHALVGAARCLKPADGLAARPRSEPEGNRVVELAHAFRLLARRQLVDQSRARESPLRQLRECAIAGLVVGRPTEDVPERQIHELVVRDHVRGELGGEPLVHHVYS